MRDRAFPLLTGLSSGVLLPALLLVGLLPADDKAKPATKDLFGVPTVWQFHLELSAKEWETLQPAGGIRFPGFGGTPAPTPPPVKPGEKPADVHKGGSFGIEFPFAHAAFTAEGKTYKDVGLRYKGGGSYVTSTGSLKRNFKVELDHNDPEQRFHGLKKLNLNAGAMDTARVRETLAYSVYRAAGVPAPRTTFAEVSLTVAGKYDKELLGLYTVVEQIDKNFLQAHFKNNNGLLMKPEIRMTAQQRGPLADLGDDWEPYKAALQPKREATKKEAQRLIDFVRLLNKADDTQFRKEIGSYLDVDEYLRFLAVTSLVANMDSFFTGGHNFYVYLNPATNRLVFIPWDVDLAFGGFPMSGTPEQLSNLSLTHPYAGEHKLTDRLLADPAVSAKYQEVLKDLAANVFTKDKLLKEIDAIEKTTKEPLAREKQAVEARKERAGMALFGQPMDLRTFLTKRTDSVATQLAGTNKGFMPTSGLGFGGGGRPAGGGGGGASFMAKPLFTALDKDKDGKVTQKELVAGARQFFTDSDKDKKGTLDSKLIAEGINRIFPLPEGLAPPAGGGGFGPGNFMAGAVVRRADADKDGKVTLDELVAAAESLYKEADKEKKDALDEKQLGDGIRLLFPPPPGFGQPPGGTTPDKPAIPKDDKKEEKKP